jgi:hypothetical protein
MTVIGEYGKMQAQIGLFRIDFSSGGFYAATQLAWQPVLLYKLFNSGALAKLSKPMVHY